MGRLRSFAGGSAICAAMWEAAPGACTVHFLSGMAAGTVEQHTIICAAISAREVGGQWQLVMRLMATWAEIMVLLDIIACSSAIRASVKEWPLAARHMAF